jgi:hypothetical protein
MLTPHSTNVSGVQALALLESLVPTLGLDPAQEIGLRSAIDELREFAEGDALEDQLESARESEREHCENEHADVIDALEKDHANALDDARVEAREAGYELGAQDAESAIERMLTLDDWPALIERCVYNDAFGSEVYDACRRREVAEREAEREREAISLRQQLDREQAERDRLAAVRKRGAPRKPRAKKAGSK